MAAKKRKKEERVRKQQPDGLRPRRLLSHGERRQSGVELEGRVVNHNV